MSAYIIEIKKKKKMKITRNSPEICRVKKHEFELAVVNEPLKFQCVFLHIIYNNWYYEVL